MNDWTSSYSHQERSSNFSTSLLKCECVSLFLFLAVPCGLRDLSSCSRTEPGPQQWTCQILTTRSPGNSLSCLHFSHSVFVKMTLKRRSERSILCLEHLPLEEKYQGLRAVVCVMPKSQNLPMTTREPISDAKAREFLLPSWSWGSHRYQRSSYREEPWVLGYIAYIGYSRWRNLKNGSFRVGRCLIGYLLWKG